MTNPFELLGQDENEDPQDLAAAAASKAEERQAEAAKSKFELSGAPVPQLSRSRSLCRRGQQGKLSSRGEACSHSTQRSWRWPWRTCWGRPPKLLW
eukprot:scaffold7253_cov385-Prasinococcus_capsulatus_cf.AAC.2